MTLVACSISPASRPRRPESPRVILIPDVHGFRPRDVCSKWNRRRHFTRGFHLCEARYATNSDKLAQVKKDKSKKACESQLETQNVSYQRFWLDSLEWQSIDQGLLLEHIQSSKSPRSFIPRPIIARRV